MISIDQFSEYLTNEDSISLETLAEQALLETQKRFGSTIELYAPLYISNRCASVCSYCNFNARNKKMIRKDLTLAQAERELKSIKKEGMDDILLLTGEMQDTDRIDFVLQYVKLAGTMFTRIGLEIFPCDISDYQRLHNAGVDYVTVYQETYNREVYERVHKAGQKKNYDYRFETPRRILKSGIRGVGMGVLLGLSEPKIDLLALAKHLIDMRREFWQADYAISFPRIRDRSVAYPVSDVLLARAIFLFRLLFPDAALLLSTREESHFRNGIAGIGINKMSAGSRTTVGGYGADEELAENGQFDIEDTRSVSEVIYDLKAKGLSPVWKNHEKIYG